MASEAATEVGSAHAPLLSFPFYFLFPSLLFSFLLSSQVVSLSLIFCSPISLAPPVTFPFPFHPLVSSRPFFPPLLSSAFLPTSPSPSLLLSLPRCTTLAPDNVLTALQLRPGTSISGTSTRPGTMAAASRPGTTAASRPGTKTAPLPDGVRGDGIASGADVLAIPEDEDEDTGEHRAGGVVYAQPAGRTAPLQPRPVTAPETARSGLQTGGVRRRRRLDASEKEWVPYGWTSGYRRDELRESAVEDEMGGAGIALEIPDRSGSPTDDPLDLNMNPRCAKWAFCSHRDSQAHLYSLDLQDVDNRRFLSPAEIILRACRLQFSPWNPPVVHQGGAREARGD